MRLYKFLDQNGKPANGGIGIWELPRGKCPGAWMPTIKELVPCASGYHLCRMKDLVLWCAPELYLAEYDGKRITCDDKVVVARARLVARVSTWNERTARLFACDCAERALELTGSHDQCLVDVIAVARRYAEGHSTNEELSAARDAAWTAARAAARNAAWNAARAAARDAAWADARAAAWAAARAAAWDATRAAAWAAARAAAWDATRAAARNAAWDAEHKWQTRRLSEYLRGKRGYRDG